MRTVLIFLAATAIPATPSVRLTNLSRPASNDFQVGDRFEVVISGPANSPVSLPESYDTAEGWQSYTTLSDSASVRTPRKYHEVFSSLIDSKNDTLKAPTAPVPSDTLRLLQKLSDSTSDESLKAEIARTEAYVQSQ
jgi:hypothetical protein